MPDAGMGRGRLRALLSLMCAALALVIGAGSSLALALPDIARSTGAGQTELTWVVNVYALVFAGLLLPLGIAADRFGRRGALLLGLAVFAGANLAAGVVAEPVPLIVLRALAGAGAAAVMPATLSVLVDAFPPERRASAIGVWAAVSGAGALLGLLLAGVLLEVASWGSVLIAFGILSAVVLALCVPVVPPSRNPALSLDLLGGMLALVGLSGLVYGIVEGPERGWSDAATLAGLVVGLLTLTGFVLHELRTPHPMLDVRLFRHPGLAAGSSVVFLQFFAAFGLFFLAPQWLQYGHGLTPLEAALWLAPMALGIGPTAQAGPALLRRFGPGSVAAWGMAQMAVALVLLAAQADTTAPLWQFGGTLFLFGIGFGLALTPGTQLIIDGLPSDRRTVAAAVNDVTREVGGALGGAVAASVLLAVYRSDVLRVADWLPAGAAHTAGSGVAQAFGIASRSGRRGADLVEGARNAFADGFATAMLVGAGVLLLGAVVCGLVAPRASGGRHRAPALASPGDHVTPARHPVISVGSATAVRPKRRPSRRTRQLLTSALVCGVILAITGVAASLQGRVGEEAPTALQDDRSTHRTPAPQPTDPTAPDPAVPADSVLIPPPVPSTDALDVQLSDPSPQPAQAPVGTTRPTQPTVTDSPSPVQIPRTAPSTTARSTTARSTTARSTTARSTTAPTTTAAAPTTTIQPTTTSPTTTPPTTAPPTTTAPTTPPKTTPPTTTPPKTTPPTTTAPTSTTASGTSTTTATSSPSATGSPTP